jgi:hypothetical protein
MLHSDLTRPGESFWLCRQLEFLLCFRMRNLCLLLPLFLFASCATITRGVHEKFKVLSEPTSAYAELSSGERGLTPVTFVKRRKENFDVTVSKPGYIAQTVKVRSNFSPTGGGAMAGNLIAGGVVGVGVDAVSGASLSLYPNPVVPQSKSVNRAQTNRKSGKATHNPERSPPPQ